MCVRMRVDVCVLILVCKDTKGNRCNQESLLEFLFQACLGLHARLQVIAVINKSRIFARNVLTLHRRGGVIHVTCDLFFVESECLPFCSFLELAQVKFKLSQNENPFCTNVQQFQWNESPIFYTANIFMVVIRETVLTEREKMHKMRCLFPLSNIFLCCHLNVVSVRRERIQMCVIGAHFKWKTN